MPEITEVPEDEEMPAVDKAVAEHVIDTFTGVTKEILVAGSDYINYKQYPIARLHIRSSLEGCEEAFDDSRWKEEPYEVRLDKNDLVPGLQQAVKQMKIGEKSKITVQPDLAFSHAMGPYGIPASSTMVYEVELVGVDSQTQGLTGFVGFQSGDKLSMANDLKEDGNNAFKAGNLVLAKGYYTDALGMLIEPEEQGGEDAVGIVFSDQDKKQLDSVVAALNMNLANVAMKQERYMDAIEHCTKSLDRVSTNPKTYFRRGSCYLIQGYAKEAKVDLLKASQLDPTNAVIRQKLVEAQKRLDKDADKQKKAFGGMINTGGVYDDKKSIKQEVKHEDKSGLPRVWLDIKVGKNETRRVTIALYNDILPKTCENFRALCTGEKGTGSLGKPLHYKDSVFHKLVPGTVVQGGDFHFCDGTGGESIYGRHFESEGFSKYHNKRGLIGLAHSGPDTNNSQFYFTLGRAPHLDNKHVLFGEIEDGIEVLDAIGAVEVDKNWRPCEEIRIVDSGVASWPDAPSEKLPTKLPEGYASSFKF